MAAPGRGSIVVKAKLGDDLRRVTFGAEELSFAALEDTLQQLFAADAPHGVRIRYKDEVCVCVCVCVSVCVTTRIDMERWTQRLNVKRAC